MKILWFKSGPHTARIKIDNRIIYIAGSKFGLDKFVPLNTQFNEEEMKQFANLKTEEEIAEEAKKEMRKQGFKFILVEGEKKQNGPN